MPGFTNPFYSSSSSSEIPPPPSSSANHPITSIPTSTSTAGSGRYTSSGTTTTSGGSGWGSSANAGAGPGPGNRSSSTTSPPAYAPSLPNRGYSSSYSNQNYGAGGASASASDEPARYTSLADLTKGRAVPPPPSVPAYGRAQGQGQQYGQGQQQQQQQGSARGDGRYMSPAPGNYGVGIPAEPPRRNVAQTENRTNPAAPTKPTGASAYFPAGAQGYADQASSYASAGVSRARDGLDGVFTQQRKDQVLSGVTSAAATGAKLLGKGAWQLGKFATGGGK